LVDVREPSEIELGKGKIPTAHNIPIGEVQDALTLGEEEWKKKYLIPKIKPSDKVIFYCQSGKRAERACQIAQSAGFSNVWNYKGSALEWFERK